MNRLLLCLLLMLGLANGLNTLTYSFPAQATSTYQRPAYSLGYLYANTPIVISITLPDNSGYDLSPTNVFIAITDSANQATVKSFGAGSSPSCGATNTCQLQWTVESQGSYFLQINAVASGTEIDYLVRYNVFVTANGAQILRISDVLRQHILKYFYVATSSPVTITQWPSDSTGNYPVLLIMNANNRLDVASTMSLSMVSEVGLSKTYVVTLAAGYYAIQFNSATTLSVSVTFQSDQYACPYTSDYPDFYGIFQGCTPTGGVLVSPGLPCLNFDYGVNRCINCMSGYTVGSNGGCLLANSCGSRQYFHFGVCSDVNPNCGSFDAYTGDCLTCANSTLQLQNGQCSATYSPCRDDQFLLNSRCVSKYCGRFDDATGGCINCISAAYYLNGTQCFPINCGNGYYFSLAGNGCRPTP